MPYSENGSTAPIGAAELSPRSRIAGWVSEPSLTPVPSPAGAGEGTGVRALHPRACALGYNLPPLTGLRKGRPHEEDFISGLLTQDTSRRRIRNEV